MTSEKKVGRRAYLKYIISGIIGAAIVGAGIGAYYATLPPPPKVRSIKIDGGPVGGGMHVQLTPLATIIEGFTDIEVKLMVSAGLVDATYNVSKRIADLTLSDPLSIQMGKKGVEPFKEPLPDTIRGIMVGAPSDWLMGSLEPIESLDKLKKRIEEGGVSTLTKCALSYHTTRKVVEEWLKIKPAKFLTLPPLEAADSLVDKVVAVTMDWAGYPVDTQWETIGAKTGYKFYVYSFTEEEAKGLAKVLFDVPMIVEKEPGYKLPKIRTLVLPWILIVNKDVSEDIVYDITKTLVENFTRLPTYAAAFKYYSYKKEDLAWLDKTIGLHPGALKYYKEKGLY